VNFTGIINVMTFNNHFEAGKGDIYCLYRIFPDKQLQGWEVRERGWSHENRKKQ